MPPFVLLVVLRSTYILVLPFQATSAALSAVGFFCSRSFPTL